MDSGDSSREYALTSETLHVHGEPFAPGFVSARGMPRAWNDCQVIRARTGGAGFPQLAPGQRIRLPGESGIVVVELVQQQPDRLNLYVQDDETVASFRRVSLTIDQASRVEAVSEDGAAAPEVVIAGLWTEWMLGAVRSARSTVLASTPLKPFPHQMAAVYGQMVTQPLLRFLLADEPGTGKTIMSGLWLREAQRKGLVKRALVVCPAHLVIKWRADFERFFGGGLREVTSGDDPPAGSVGTRRGPLGGVAEPGCGQPGGTGGATPRQGGVGRDHLRRGSPHDPDRSDVPQGRQGVVGHRA